MKNILIIGGSSGIGAALAQLELNTNKVIIINRSASDITHSNLIQHNLDITKDELPYIETLDALIYCPGSINLKPFKTLKTKDFEDDFQINVMGAIKCIQFYLNALKKANHSSIVLFSTVAVQKGMAFHSSISMSKGAIEGLTRALAAEFAPNILVNCVAPSITNTPLAASLLKSNEAIENIAQKHPLKRILTANDVAELVQFIIHQKSSSGHIYAIDGGLSS